MGAEPRRGHRPARRRPPPRPADRGAAARSSCSSTDDDLDAIERAVPGRRAPPATATTRARWQMLDSEQLVLTRERDPGGGGGGPPPPRAGEGERRRRRARAQRQPRQRLPPLPEQGGAAGGRRGAVPRELSAAARGRSTTPTQWFDTLIATKRATALEDPELFATYVGAGARVAATSVSEHVDHLIAQLARIVGDERDRPRDVRSRPRASTTPRTPRTWGDAGIDEDVRGGLGATGSGDRAAGVVGPLERGAVGAGERHARVGASAASGTRRARTR